MTDRLLTINIRRYLVTQPRTKRARKAAKYLRERIAHYTKIPEENIRFSQELNTMIFKYYLKHMTPVKLKVKIGTDTADVLPFKEGEVAKPEVKDAKQEKKPLFAKAEKKEEKKEAPKPAAPASAPAKKETPKTEAKPAK